MHVFTYTERVIDQDLVLESFPSINIFSKVTLSTEVSHKIANSILCGIKDEGKATTY